MDRLHRPSFTLAKGFLSETTRPILIKSHKQRTDYGGTKVYSNGLHHMTKMAAMPIYGENLKKVFFFRIKKQKLGTLKLGI